MTPYNYRSQLFTVRGRDNVTDIAIPVIYHYAALEAQSEACMTCGAVAAQIQIELIIFLIQSQLFHTLLQNLQIVFTLLPPMISPIPGTRQSIAATVLPSSFNFM